MLRISPLIDRRTKIAHWTGLIHFVAAFGFTPACLIAFRSHSPSVAEQAFGFFGALYATTAALAFVTLLVSLYRCPRSEVRARARSFHWIIAAQAVFIVQSGIGWLLIPHR